MRLTDIGMAVPRIFILLVLAAVLQRLSVPVLIGAGVNPIEARREVRRAASRQVSAMPGAGATFRTFGLAMIEAWAPGWKSTATGKKKAHRPGREDAQKKIWIRTVEVYCSAIADMPIADISTDDVLTVVRPLWNDQHATAIKVRQHTEKILAAATAAGLRRGDNPARFKNHLDLFLPAVTAKVRHHPSMPYDQVPAFVKQLRAVDSVSAYALEFLILTAARTSEVCFAAKAEVVYGPSGAVWVVPEERMKEDREHRVPLVDRAAEIARTCAAASRPSVPWLFANPFSKDPLSTGAMDDLLQERLKRNDCTVHGFRASFKSWAKARSRMPRSVAEAALAHVAGELVEQSLGNRIGDRTEQAYDRDDALDLRRELMQMWADFIEGKR